MEHNCDFHDKEKTHDGSQIHFYQQNWFIFLMLFFCAPIGIFLLFHFKKWSTFAKLSAAFLSLIWFLFVIFSDYPPSSQTTSAFDTYPSFTENETDETVSSENILFSVSREETKNLDIATESKKSTTAIEHTKTTTENSTSTEYFSQAPTHSEPIGSEYVLNTNTKVYHRPDCRYTKKIKAENFLLSSTIPSDYRPCKVCKP